MMHSKTRARLKALQVKTKVKHIVDSTNLAADLSTTQNIILVQGVDNPILANTYQVATDSLVHNIILQVNFHNLQTNTTNVVRVDWCLFYNPKGQTATMPDPTTLGSNTLKDNVFKTGMEMVNNTNVVMLKGVIKIPKKWQKIGRDDEIRFVYRFSGSTGNTDSVCLHALYREYR